MKEEVTLKEKFTQWRVFYRWGSRIENTRPLTPDECLKHFRKCYAVMYMNGDTIEGLTK